MSKIENAAIRGSEAPVDEPVDFQPEVVTPEGEVLSPEFVAHAYTREGRWLIGKEFPNPVPLEPPLGFVPSVPLYEQIRSMVLAELGQRDREEFETDEEADDFEVGDDYDPHSPWEFEPTASWPPADALDAAKETVRLAREAVEASKKKTGSNEPADPSGPTSAGGGGAQPPSDKP